MASKAAERQREVSAAGSSRYELLDVIAAGGMGRVYRAYDRLGERHVAYKQLGRFADAQRARMMPLFQREYEALARLSHPNIVDVFDYGFDAAGPYYTMELLTGADLTALAPLSFADGARIIRDVASALSLLHARRLLHRDVTPGNVRLTEDGRAKLIDFGGLTKFGKPSEIVGTAAFIAPECLQDAALDQRADLYALGALAYWTFTRRTHVRARALEELAEAWKEPVLPPSAHAPNLPPELDDLVLSLLRFDPNARPASAADVMERLTRLAYLPPEADESRVAYSYLARPPLAGRDGVLGSLQHALRTTLAGFGQIVCIEAERGLGRSALLESVGVEAQLLGATVLRADGALHRSPLATLHKLVSLGRNTLQQPESRPSARASGRSGAWAVAAHGWSPRSTIDVSERHAAEGSSLIEELLAIGRETPLVLLIDDAHRADPESLNLFAAMAESIPRHRILLVVSTLARHADDRDQGGAQLLQRAAIHRLANLSEPELAEALEHVFGRVPNAQRLAQWLHRATGGNPGDALELARLLLARGAIRYEVGTFVLPHEVDVEHGAAERSDAQLARLEGASVNARRAAELLALADVPLQPEQVAAALGIATPAALRELEELVTRSIAANEGRLFVFAGEALRAAVLRRTEPAQARLHHIALARALEKDASQSLAVRIAMARHLLLAGGEERIAGAHLLAQSGDDHRFEVAMMRRALPVFEEALSVLKEQKYSDRECVGVLVPLSLAGFYGSLELQRRYLDRTLKALSKICGLSLAGRLRRVLGAQLALMLGMLIGFVLFTCQRRRLNRRSFLENLLAFTSLLGPAAAAAACTYDVDETYRIARYCEPFAGAPRRSGLYGVREFCIATAELIEGRLKSAYRRYGFVFENFKRPVSGMDDALREQASLGCLNGMAHALVTDGERGALSHADELAQRGAFYIPHAESVHMTYYANRGETALAAVHRERSEAFALRGGMSWAALVTLSQRSMQAFSLTGDVVGLVRVSADLTRLAGLSPCIAVLAELARANLEQLRGRPEQAIATYERVLSSELARRMPTHPFDVSMFAQALSATGDHARAREICSALLQGPTHREFLIARLLPQQKLALAEAGLGDTERAVELLDDCIARALPNDNPLTLGALHRDRAYVAALSGDRAGFEQHAACMQAHFETTRNPMLLLQCDALRSLVARLGMVARPSLPFASVAADEDVDLKTAVGVTVGVTVGVPIGMPLANRA